MNEYVDPFKSLNDQNRREREAYFSTSELVKERTFLTRREQFAMAALQGMLAAGPKVKLEEIISVAVAAADGLVQQLGEKEHGT